MTVDDLITTTKVTTTSYHLQTSDGAMHVKHAMAQC